MSLIIEGFGKHAGFTLRLDYGITQEALFLKFFIHAMPSLLLPLMKSSSRAWVGVSRTPKAGGACLLRYSYDSCRGTAIYVSSHPINAMVNAPTCYKSMLDVEIRGQSSPPERQVVVHA